jgi:acetyl esterase
VNPLQRLQVHALVQLLHSPEPVLRRLARTPAEIAGQALDLHTRVFLTLLRLDGVAHHLLSPAEQRAEIEFIERAFAKDPRPLRVETLALDLPGRSLRALHWHAPGEGPRPALLYLHGGGFVTGTPESYAGPCSRMAEETGCDVIVPDYRLAPEHPFPAAVDDAIDAFRWLRSHAEAMGLDPHRLAVGGDSAGGNLATAVCNSLSAAERPVWQLLLFPGTQPEIGTPSRQTFAEGFYLTTTLVEAYFTAYLPNQAERRDPRAAPLLAPELAPVPALVCIAGLDPLADEGRLYAARLREFGAPVDVMEIEGMVHGFVSLDRILPAADKALGQIFKAMRRAIQVSGAYSPRPSGKGGE